MKSTRWMLIYPPVSSVWHVPAGISELAAVLEEAGHVVLQWYGHIADLKYVLSKEDKEGTNTALRTIMEGGRTEITWLERLGFGKSERLAKEILAWYQARMLLEKISSNIRTNDTFVVQRNNVLYVSGYYDGTIEKALEAVKNREQHLWHDCFMKQDIAAAKEFRPDIVGISIADERQFIQGLILASLIKDLLPKILVVLGGNFWSRMMHAFSLPGFEKFFDHCDAIVYGEGHQQALELAATLDPSQSSGTVWRKNGKVIVNPRAQTPVDFEKLPTPIFEGFRQWSPDIVPSIYTMSNCPMKCDFCAIAAGSATFLGPPRKKSPPKTAEQMIHLGKTIGATRFDITDEIFSIDRQLALGKELKRRRYKATWNCYLTITNDLLDPKVCRNLFKSGCRVVQLGLESLSRETLRSQHKGWNHPKYYGRILMNLKKAGIQTHVFLLIGLPGEPLHCGLRWLAFLEKYGEYILTIKAGRYRLTRMSPEEQFGRHSDFIRVKPDTKPLHLNRDFEYENVSMKWVDAIRALLEEACRRHWAYAVTSTIQWNNRWLYTWKELEFMAKLLPREPPVPHFNRVLTKVSAIVRDELKQNVQFKSYEDVLAFARTMK